MKEWIALGVLFFGLSALVSYVAQRVQGRWVEFVSDLLFIGGAALLMGAAACFVGWV